MPLYAYVGRDKGGNKVEGVSEAPSEKSLATQLMTKHITPIEIKETRQAETTEIITTKKKKITPEELIIFCRQMAAMMKSGIPIVRALNGIAESVSNDYFAEVLADIHHHLTSGVSLTQAMRLQDNVFSDLIINLINVGETTGQMENAFKRIVQSLEMERETKRRINKATRYPTTVIIAITVALVIVNVYVIPSFEGVFNKLGADLPLPTKMLLASSNFMVNYGGLILIGLASMFFSFKYYIKTESGAYWWGRKKLELFIIGSLVKRITLARFARTLSMLLASGLPMVQSLRVTTTIVENAFISAKINEIRRNIEQGAALGRVVANTQMFTPLVVQMISVGEETGQLEQLLDHVADFYEDEIDYELDQLSARLEPLILLAMGVLVLILILGIFLPIWQIYEQFQS